MTVSQLQALLSRLPKECGDQIVVVRSTGLPREVTTVVVGDNADWDAFPGGCVLLDHSQPAPRADGVIRLYRPHE